MIIPKELYRGDDDRENKRLLRETVHFNQFHTNLISGGFGRKIFDEPLIELVNKHILSRFENTHFLSFTNDKTAALRYGLNLTEADEETVNNCSFIYLEGDNIWDFVLLTIETDRLKITQNPFPGVYECYYNPTLLNFANSGEYRIFLVDTFTALQATDPTKFKTAMYNSKRDHEWLVLPATFKSFEFGKVEFSAILDGGCFGQTEYYRINQEQYQLFKNKN